VERVCARDAKTRQRLHAGTGSESRAPADASPYPTASQRAAYLYTALAHTQ
jgi:hypothetical protein